MPKLFLTKTFQKNFEKLDQKTQVRIKKALVGLRDGGLEGKPLSGDMKGEYSFRAGDYRVIYAVVSDEIFLESVRHRKDVYKRKK